MNTDPLEHTWTVLAAELRAAVGEPLFDVWLAPLTVAAFDGSHLVLQAPAETREWVTERFGRILQTSVAAAFGPQVDLEVERGGQRRRAGRARDGRTFPRSGSTRSPVRRRTPSTRSTSS